MPAQQRVFGRDFLLYQPSGSLGKGVLSSVKELDGSKVKIPVLMKMIVLYQR
jgi:hypothetical protein